MRLVCAAAVLSLSSCSFTTATGFDECNNDMQCGADRVCIQRFCIRLPPSCQRGAGDYGQANRVAFGALLPLTSDPDGGEIDESERANLEALELAVDEGNMRDGIKGRHFALFVCNTGDDDATLKAQADFMANTLEVPAVVVSGSAATISAANVLAPTGSLVISADATSPELNGTFASTQGLVWRTAPPDSLQAQVVVDRLSLFRASQPSLQNIGIAYVDSTYGQGLSHELQSRAMKASFMTKAVPYPRGQDPAPALAALSAFQPNLTVLVAFPDDVIRLVEGAQGHPNLTRLGGNQWFFTDAAKDPAILAPSILSEIDSSYGTAPAQGAGMEFAAFRDRFEAKYMKDPNSYGFTSHSYDAMYLLMLGAAYASAGGQPITGVRIAEGLTKMSSGPQVILTPDNFSNGVSLLQMGQSVDVMGSSSNLDLDPDAGCPLSSSSPYELWQIRDGGFVTTQVITPTGS